MTGAGSPAPGYGLVGASVTTEGTDSSPETTSLQTSSDTSELSHLDTIFANSGWTREDILVVAAALDVVLFALLIYLEVGE